MQGKTDLSAERKEEKIKPFIFESKYSRYLSGPFTPDAFFANKMYRKFDSVLGMYHDQALIPFKLINFGWGVNYTPAPPVRRCPAAAAFPRFR